MPANETSAFTPGYVASKIRDGQWGVFYRISERQSFGPQGKIHSTKKAATSDANTRNWCEAEIAKDANGEVVG